MPQPTPSTLPPEVGLEWYGRQQSLEMSEARRARRKAIWQKRNPGHVRGKKPEKPLPERQKWSDWWYWPRELLVMFLPPVNHEEYFRMIARARFEAGALRG